MSPHDPSSMSVTPLDSFSPKSRLFDVGFFFSESRMSCTVAGSSEKRRLTDLPSFCGLKISPY